MTGKTPPIHSRMTTHCVSGLAAMLFSVAPLVAQQPAPKPVAADPAAVKFFETKIRPLLNDQCMKCHGEKKQKGGLRLDSLQAALQGGDGGAAVTPHDVPRSLLFKAVTYDDQDLQMPPDAKLEPAEIEDLKKWIEMGAPWPDDGKKANVRKPGEFSAEDRAWWAFQPVKQATPPKIANVQARMANPIDQFILDRLQREGLTQAPEADRFELIRRVSFDLNGIPPTYEELEKLVADKDEKFYEKLVDSLLDNPRYGERWAQHWLDLVRYAESDGFRQDAYRPDAWRYRDYVVRSFNEDKPYDRFVREQLAGDELAPEDPNALIATSFFRQSVYEYNQRDVEGQRTGILNDMTDVTGEVFMGLSFGCARCHDHKFDPILQKDYYRLQAFLAPIVWRDDLKLAEPEVKREYDEKMAAWNAATASIRTRMEAALAPKIASAKRKQEEKFPEEVQEMYYKPEDQKSAFEKQVSYFVLRQADEETEAIRKGTAKGGTTAKPFLAELKHFDNLKPRELPKAFVVTDVGPDAPPVKFASRRDGETEVKPGFLTILAPGDAVITPPVNVPSTGRRSALAAWVTRPDNMLASRVIVNRVWQYHFGVGLVATSSDFGRLGEKPSHPELLDWLTTEFVKNGWSIKWLHRMILNSATYKQTARIKPSETASKKDPENRLLWRMSPRRLDASQARDALLVMSGELKDTHDGPGMEPVVATRAIFTRKIRNRQDDFLRNFDTPSGFQSVSRRDQTTTALQSLLMINGDWPLRRAQTMAAALLKDNGRETESAVEDAYRAVYGRSPRSAEVKSALTFINEQRMLIEGESPQNLEPEASVVDAKLAFGDSPLVAPRAVAGAQDTGVARAAAVPQAIMFKPGTINEKLHVITNEDREGDEFTVEAVLNLDTIYMDAAVRTIVSRWNNDKAAKGWSFGITSKGSRYEPHNLIMQLVGDDFQRSVVHEVVASGIKIPTNIPYYVAAVVSNHPANDQQSGGTVTFYAKNLSDPNAQLEVVVVQHQLIGGYVDKERALMIGGLDGDARGNWDGAMARVALCNTVLNPPQLIVNGAEDAPKCLFDLQGSNLGSTSEPLFAWEKSTGGKRHVKNSQEEAFADFCHALINSSEFLYLH